MSPHIGGLTADAYVKMGVASVEDALAVLRQDPSVGQQHAPMDAISAGAAADSLRRNGAQGAAPGPALGPGGSVQLTEANTPVPELHPAQASPPEAADGDPATVPPLEQWPATLEDLTSAGGIRRRQGFAAIRGVARSRPASAADHESRLGFDWNQFLESPRSH